MAIDYEEVTEEETKKTTPKSARLISSFIGVNNIVPMLDAEIVQKIGLEVTRGFDLDKASRADWEKQTKVAMDLATQVTSEKSWPWPKAANVKYPLITTAAIQFSARAYPAIVRGAEVVKGEVLGPDPDGSKKARAERIGQHMSYQVLEEIQDWDEEEDKLLLQMSIVGCAFRKSYFDTMLGRPCSDLVSANDIVYDHATPWKKLRRITHCLNLFKNDVIERVRAGIFKEIELGLPSGEDNDEDGHFEFLEQHCWYDLDEDGYKEPYIVTVKKDSSEVVRILARFDPDKIYLNGNGQITKIVPVEYFTKFAFMPNPDGGSYDVGLGMLLNPINETVNTVFNQMLDAGTLANTGGGFLGSGLKMKGGVARFTPGEFKPVESAGGKIADNIYHMQFAGPNPVLFNLLGMLIEAGKDISSVKDILTGDQQVNQTATTTLALIEQGQKVFSAIYKRVHRSLKQEFKKLYRLNKLYLKPQDYYRFQDKVEQITLEDYQGDETDVAPVSDPNLVSDAQELTRAEALLQFVGSPMINQIELHKRYLKAIKVQDIETLLVEEEQIPPELQKKMMMLQERLQQTEQALQEADKQLQQAQSDKEQAMIKLQTDIQLAEADRQAKDRQAQIDAQVALDKANLDAQVKLQLAEINNQAAKELEIMKSDFALVKEKFMHDARHVEARVAGGLDVPACMIGNEEPEIEKPTRKVIEITAPSGAVYRGVIEESEDMQTIGIESPTGGIYSGTVQ